MYMPIWVVRLEDSRFVYNELATEAIVAAASTDADTHTVVLGVSGPAGSGKSSFLNWIVRCLLPADLAYTLLATCMIP
jgi:putative protein kinase ArgK-like GTPase of G3E family